jgi:hypothetical protein
VHGDTLGGPVFLFVIGVLWFTGVVSLWVTSDSLRARREAMFSCLPEPRWFYAVPQGAYFVMFVLGQIGIGGGVVALAAPLVLVQQVAYLLRVVFPTPERLASCEISATTVSTLPEE